MASDVKARLVGRIVEFGLTVGYQVKVEAGGKEKTSKLPEIKVVQLIEKGANIDGVTVDKGTIIVDNSLYKKLPVLKSVYKITETIKDDNGRAIGYDIVNTEDESEKHRIDIKSAWKLAVDGCIKDMSAHIIKGSNKKILVKAIE